MPELLADRLVNDTTPYVLVVTRNSEAGERLCAELRRASYRAVLATGGRAALRTAVRVHPALVVQDLVLADMEGATLIQALRRLPGLAKVPAIALGRPASANSDEHSPALFARTLTGPINPAELIGVAVQLLSDDSDHAGADLGGEGPLAGDLHRLIRANTELRERLASQSVELAFLAGFGVGISSGAGADRLLDEVLTRCAEIAGFACGAAYLAVGDGRPVLQGHVGFTDGEPLRDFFGEPTLLTDAIAIAGAGIARLPSEQFDEDRTQLVLDRGGLGVLLVAPVVEADELLGVLVLGSPRATTTPSQEMLIAAIAAQVGRWLSRVRTLSALSRSQGRTVERLARAAEFRDEETANHTQRVSRYCGLLARLSGVNEWRSELIAAASVMHDIGKLGIPDSILRKPGKLSSEERVHMERHADYGRKILAGEPDPLLDLAAVIAWTHHERWDGAGYPRRLRGDQIPLEGRIVAIGDVFDALTSNRVYRPAMKLAQALALMQAGRGTQFDPQLLDMFIGAMPQVLDIRRRHPDELGRMRSFPVSVKSARA